MADADISSFDVIDPASGKKLAEVTNMDAVAVCGVIEQAHAAQVDWARQTAGSRARMLRALLERMQLAREEFAQLITLETGKPLTEARAEVDYAASFLEWFAEEAKRIYGETIPAPRVDQRILVQREPVGVVAAITPWNFPLAMITRKIAPALAVGCTAIVKPAEETPLCALRLAKLALEVGLPEGVLNIVTGTDAAAIGNALAQSPLVRALSFTGSTDVGRHLMAACAPTIKKVSLELGGNAPFLVFEDADLDKAVEAAIIGKFRNAGQTCVCVNRFIVAHAVFDEFTEKLTNAVSRLKVGNGLEESTEIGPLINEAAVGKVQNHIQDAVRRGAKLLLGGGCIDGPGNFVEPTVIVDVSLDALISREETFGPLAALYRFGKEDEAIAIANSTPFGLAAYFFTKDYSRVIRVAEALEAGIVGVNDCRISTEVAPFGGIKQSGLGREGSRHAIEEFVELKYVCIGI